MSPEELQSLLPSLLSLQREIDEKLDVLSAGIKKLMDAHKGRIIVSIEGHLYELARTDSTTQAVTNARKHGGFFLQYRLVKLPEPLK